MNRIIHIKTALFLLIGYFANAQDVVWTGSASNNDFFDEGNWKNSVTNVVPAIGTIDPGLAINLPLQINTVTTTITAIGEINLGTGSFSISMANLTASSFSGAGGTVTVNEGGYVELTDTTPFKSTTPKVQINFTSGIGWIKTTNYSARFVSITNLSQIKVNGSASVYKTNLRLDNYYLKGCVIRSNEASTSPLTVYDDANLLGASGLIPVNTIHSADAIPGAMNNKIESFILKKGFMVTFAVENDGTGKSKNYIASEEDLVINSLPRGILNSISFIRVLPWNWVTKKGRTDTPIDLNTSWRYKWNPDEVSTVNWEFTPMSWGHTSADDPNDIANYIGKYNTPYVMSFNEPDDCSGQSGQYGNLCQTDVAVGYHKNLMKTGLRIVSPGGREEAPFGWLKEFYNKATAQDIRVDVIAVHWYDWGSNPTVVTNPTALQVFNRFKAYLTNVHNLYGLPIWITEFNANPARSQAVNSGFLALALPYLESLDYIERYNWFPFNTGTDFYSPMGSTTLSSVGNEYKNQVSTPSIPEATVNANNNFNLANFPNVALNKTATASSTYFTYMGSNAVDGDTTTSTSQWIKNFGVSGDSFYSPLPAWLEVDLQGSFTIDSFAIIEATSALKNFRFEVWDTTLNSGTGGWVTALTVTNNPATPLTTYKTFSPVTTSKVRLYITGHNSLDYLKIFELEVYGLSASVLGVQKFEKQAFTLYPNPVTNGVLNISGDQEVQSVHVYTVLGAKINVPFENEKLFIDDLVPGVYFLRVNKKYSIKFIKK
jgi:hypothetical protein